MLFQLRNSRRFRQLSLTALLLSGVESGPWSPAAVHGQSVLQTIAGPAPTLEPSPSVAPEFTPETAPPTPSPDAPVRPVQIGREVYQRVLHSVVFLVNGDKHGTGWVLDAERGLVITNDHVVEGAAQVDVRFPTWVNGELDTDLNHCLAQTPEVGRVLDSSFAQDLAIVQVGRLPAGTVALPLAAASSTPGDRVHAIGGYPRGSMGMWKYSTGSVGQIGTMDLDGRYYRVMQSNIDINPGNSGGAILNDASEVVGVCQSIHLEARDVSNNVDVMELRAYLQEVMPLIQDQRPEALLKLAQRHRKAGRLQAATQLLTAALQQAPNFAAAQAERGWVFLAMNDTVTAVQDFTAAINKDGSVQAAWHGRGVAHRTMKNWPQAVADFSMAIAANPNSAELYNERAIAHEFSDAAEAAIADYTRAIQMEQRNPTYLANRADLLVKLDRLQNAYEDLTKCLELSPNYGWANFLMGRVLYRSKNYKPALDYLAKANEIVADNVEYLSLLGECVQQLDDHESGVKVWGRVIELQPQFAYNYYSRAWSLRRLNRLQDALADLNRAIELKGDDAAYFKERGLVFEALGEQRQAASDFAQAKQLDPQITINSNLANGNGNRSTNGTPNGNGDRVAQNQPNRTGQRQVVHRQPVNQAPVSSPFVGRWYVNQVVNGVGIEAVQTYGADGSYHAVLNWTENGNTVRVEETGSYAMRGDQVEFNTNLGSYLMPIKLERGMLWLYFETRDLWIGSVPANQ